MKKRLSLTFDAVVIKLAKLYAKNRDESLSAIIEEFLKKLTSPVKRKTIFDMVKEFGPSNIDPKADLIDLYYQEKGKKYGF